jgi:hypothetical protein
MIGAMPVDMIEASSMPDYDSYCEDEIRILQASLRAGLFGIRNENQGSGHPSTPRPPP